MPPAQQQEQVALLTVKSSSTDIDEGSIAATATEPNGFSGHDPDSPSEHPFNSAPSTSSHNGNMYTDDEVKESLKLVLTLDYWKKLRSRLMYEAALLTSSIPHMIPKWVLLHWGAMYLFRNLAYVRHEQGPRLKDLGFDLVPEIHNDIMSEIFLYINFFTTLITVLMPIISSHAHPRGIFSVDIYFKIVNIVCVGHILRFFTFISTSLPGPAAHCQPGAPLYRESLTLYEIFTRRSRVHVDPNCGDLIFSGHMFQDTSFCAVMLANMSKLVPNRTLGRTFSCILIITCIVQPYFIIAARNHYTVDVVVSSYVAPMLWWTMEGFYTTSFYARAVVWVSKFVPRFIANYLKRHNPTQNTEHQGAPVSVEQNEELERIMKKFDTDPSYIKQLLNSQALIEMVSVLNEHIHSDKDIGEDAEAPIVFRRKRL